MPSKYDIFISYGHLDDEDPAGDVKGWVDLLVERLPRLIASTLGYVPKVWRDQRSLTGDALLRAAIEEGISNSLLFVPIVSPRYVQSDWCLREEGAGTTTRANWSCFLRNGRRHAGGVQSRRRTSQRSKILDRVATARMGHVDAARGGERV